MERMDLEGAGSAQPSTEPAGAHEDVYGSRLQTLFHVLTDVCILLVCCHRPTCFYLALR